MFAKMYLLLLGLLLSVSRASLMTLVEGCEEGFMRESADPDMLFDFTSPDVTDNDIARWIESSDTVREPGKSKATFTLQKSQLFQRAVMFALLNPQPNGAGFAGIRINVTDLAKFSHKEGFLLQARCQGQLTQWKVVLRNAEDEGSVSLVTYENLFTMNTTSEDFQEILLPFSQFKAYSRGKPVVNAPQLDLLKVGSFGLQAYGGVYEQVKQHGVGSLEINWVRFY